MKVRELMQTPVTVIAEDQALSVARGLMQWAEIRHLPVVRRSDGRVVGMLTERDLLRVYQQDGQRAAELSVRDAMTTPVEHIHPNADIADAAADMSTKRLGCLPVVELGELVGLLTVSDLLSVLGQYPTDRRLRESQSGQASVASIMHPDPIAVNEDDRLMDLTRKMLRAGVRHACVVDGDGIVTGIVSDRDVRRAIGDPTRSLNEASLPEAVQELRVERVMSRDPRTIAHGDSIQAALSILLQERYGALPVVDGDGRLKGIVSYIDVLRHLGERLGLSPAGVAPSR